MAGICLFHSGNSIIIKDRNKEQTGKPAKQVTSI